jgi:ubiquinone/menaquinone biosynthesis C-methylase UbiE
MHLVGVSAWPEYSGDDICTRRGKMNRLTLLQYLFDSAAERYERDIAPALVPLAASLAAYAAPRPDDTVLDIGTGTGLAARMIAPYVRRVIGLDLSHGSLCAARRVPAAANIHYVRGDLNRLPFPAGGFSLVIASFGLNGTDPQDSLRAIRRAVAPGGRFVLQEWGPIPPLDRALNEILGKYALEEPGEPLSSLRDWLDDDPASWRDHLQDVDDYREWLSEVGFTVTDAAEHAPIAIRIPSAEYYLAFRLAWPPRFEEVQVMDESTRSAFYAESLARLEPITAPDGSIRWEPVLFRVTARG